ncbi:MAG: Ribosome hibernation promotion factor [Chlamydiia bacterium]|nr:Ribosome hibernation promotion factor [Chlamydiia bacterium]
MDDDLKLRVVGKGVEVTPALQAHITERLSKIEHLTPQVISVTAHLEIQKTEHRCDITYILPHNNVRAHGVSTDLYASIEMACERLKNKLKRWKSKIQDHHAKSLSQIEVPLMVLGHKRDEEAEINAAIEAREIARLMAEQGPHSVVKKKTRPLKELTMDEAIMKMELSNDHFLVFRAEEDKKLKVLYERRDSSFGLLEVES